MKQTIKRLHVASFQLKFCSAVHILMRKPVQQLFGLRQIAVVPLESTANNGENNVRWTHIVGPAKEQGR